MWLGFLMKSALHAFLKKMKSSIKDRLSMHIKINTKSKATNNNPPKNRNILSKNLATICNINFMKTSSFESARRRPDP